jgi:MFS family permease
VSVSRVGSAKIAMAPTTSGGARRAKSTVLAILLAILAFNYVDRQVLALVLQNIKGDLDLSDTQLGFLSGLAFALFYAAMGIPIARLADKGNRVAIISATAAIWSVFVMLCGAAGSFVQLFLIRIGVAVGEAGCIPPAQSLLADFFPREERTRAFAIYSLGSPLSVILGGFVAGWINQYYGWRATFVILGFPGILLAILAWGMLREPRRASNSDSATDSRRQSHGAGVQRHLLKEVAHTLVRNRTFCQLLFAHTILYFFIYGVVIQWQPTFFIRTHGFTTGELGTWLLLIWSVMGTLGVYGGGFICHRFMARDERRQLQLMAASISIFGALNLLIYLSPHRYAALGLMVVAAPFYLAIAGPMFAVNQSIVPERMRATAVALMLFFANLIGMGLGGLAVGMLSDLLAPAYGRDSLRYALLAMSPGFFWCAIHFLLASRTVAMDIERANRELECVR